MKKPTRCSEIQGELTMAHSGGKRLAGPIVLACDGAYAMPLATTLRSVTDANPQSWPMKFHVLCDGMSGKLRERVEKSLPEGSAEIVWMPIGLELFEGFSVSAHVSRMTYARLMIPRLFPDCAKVLYLDTDILVLDELAPLWETDLEGAVVGAVSDTIDALLKTDDPRLTRVPRVRSYFNSGILLIDLERWRSEQIPEKALEYLSRNPKTPYWDQDAINVACDGRWKNLEGRWNFQKHRRIRIADLHPEERPAIVHFVTGDKPWNANVPSLNADFYDAFRSRTAFARTPMDKCGDLVRTNWARLKRYARSTYPLRNKRRGRGDGHLLTGNGQKPAFLQNFPH